MTGRKLAVAAALVGGFALAQAVPSDTVADIAERTLPFGKLCLQGENCGGQAAAPMPAPAATGRSGEEVYNAHCHVCHATGLNDAPKFQDAAAWATRIAQGAEKLLEVTKNGINTMPPMGTCMSCTDAELRAVIDYMIPPSEQ